MLSKIFFLTTEVSKFNTCIYIAAWLSLSKLNSASLLMTQVKPGISERQSHHGHLLNTDYIPGTPLHHTLWSSEKSLLPVIDKKTAFVWLTDVKVF